MIREARAKRRLKLREVAKATGLSVSYISDMEHGRRAIPAHRVGDLARVLGIDPDDLARHAGVVDPEIVEALKDRAFVRLVRGLMGAR